jgi:superfamily II DNA or RNA helicase
MLQLPTGTGKTVLFTSIIRDLTEVKDTKILILAHRKELIDQISEHLNLYDVDHGIISSGRKRSLEKLVQVASVQTLTHDNNIELLDELKPKFIIIDEAHHSLAESYTKFWKKCGDCWKLGVTATPYRLNNKSFRSHFDVLVQSMEIDDFISQGYLAKYDYMVDNPQSSLSQTIKSIKEKSSTGDYKTATLLKELNVPQHIQRLIVCYEQYVKGQKGIVYAINKEHAHNICDAYKLIGVEAVYIDSDTSKTDRSEIVEKFKSGEVEVMVNVDIFSEGFDCPDVEFIQLARPTWSLAKYLQQVGRGLRPCRGKHETVILDNSRMFVKFGLPSEGRLWQWHFNGEPLVKNEYKQENEEYERQLNLVCSFSNEMMVKIDHETAKMAEELALQDINSQKAQKPVVKEEMDAYKLKEVEDHSGNNNNLMVPFTTLKKEEALESIDTADVQKQRQRKIRQEDNEKIKSKMKVEQERLRRENEVILQREKELEEELLRSERNKKIWITLGYIIVLCVALFIIWETGLFIPLAIIGLIGAFGLRR